MIHTTTWYVTNAHSVSPVTWDIANVLNSASRVSRNRAALHCTIYLHQCGVSAEKPAAKASVLPLMVFLRDCGDLSGFTADSGEERRRKNVAGTNGSDWYHR
uniref:Uncharacterized protein n=1 Tax=Panagrolaimus superbus TaxID=310955 RepID=A0A914Y4X5_9BILA